MRTGFMSASSQAALASLCFFSLSAAAIGADQNNPIEATSVKADTTNESQQTLRSYLLLQEQLHNTLLTIERTRREADAAAKANADAIASRLEAIEQTMGAQQRAEAGLLQNSNRITLIATGIFAGLGLMAMVLTAWFLFRAMNRLATVATAFPRAHALGDGAAAPFAAAEVHSIDLAPVAQSSGRLLGVIERLEKRVNELEHTSQISLPAEDNLDAIGQTNGAEQARDFSLGGQPKAVIPSEAAVAVNEITERIALILGKGQALLSMDKPEEAMVCFDEAIALEPRNADALVKKGTALERLKRLEEAIACYDSAISANRSMTLAYLYKGGICNQLERFSEALECYEQALRSQQKRT